MTGVRVEQSTEQMMAGFMSLHEKGYDIPEIAREFGVHASTVYRHLGEIAERNNVSRESLLQRVCLGGFEQVRQAALRERVDCERLLMDIKTINMTLDDAILKVRGIISEGGEVR